MEPTTGRARLARWATKLLIGAVLGAAWLLAGGNVQPAGAAACTTTPAYGTTYTCAIGAAGEVDDYTVAVTAGDRIRIRIVETSGNLFALHEVRLGANVVCAQTSAESSTCRPLSSGNLTIRVTGNSSSTGNYSLNIQRLNDPVGCGSIGNGALKTNGNLPAIDELDCWSFTTAAANQVMRFRVMETNTFTAAMEVVGPNGVTVCAATTAETIDCNLPDAGNYWLHVTGVGTTFGTYNVYRQTLTGPGGCVTITPNTLTNGSIGVAGEVDCYRFNGSIGSRWRIRVLETSGNLFALQEVTRPNGTVLCANTGSEAVTCRPDSAGNQVLFVTGNATSTGNYSFHLQRLNNPVGCVDLAQGALATTGSIGAIADDDCWSMTTTVANTMTRVRLMETNGLTASIEVVGPSGLTVCGATTGESVDCNLPTIGTYWLHVTGVGTATPAYNVYRQAIDAPTGCTTLAPGSLTSGGIGVAGEVDCYRFTAAPGDRWRIRILETSGGLFALQDVLRPDGSTLCSSSGAEAVTCVIDTAGDHTLDVIGNATSTGNYRFHLQRLNNPVGCGSIGNGALKTNGNINSVADDDCLSLTTASENRLARFRLVETGALTAVLEVVGPGGVTVCAPTTAEVVDCNLPDIGTYWVHVTATGTGTGTYNLYRQLLNGTGGCATITPNTLTNASIGVAGEVDCYRFNGSVGTRWRIRLLETSGTLFALQEVTSPDGSGLCANTGAEAVTCTVDTAGLQVLYVTGNGTTTGNYSFHLQRLDNPTGCVALAAGALNTTGSIGVAADDDCWSLTTAAPNQLMRFRAVEKTAVTAVMEVVGPAGVTQCAATTAETVDCLLPAAGNYWLHVTGSGTGTGTYNVYRQALNAPTGCVNVTVGSSTAGSIGTAGEVDCFRFAGTIGQTRQVTVTETGGTLFALQEVVRPNGTTLCPSSGAQAVSCLIDETGTQTIYVIGNATTTGSYNVALN